MAWYSEKVKWFSKTGITRKKNEVIRALEIDKDEFHELIFEYAYTIVKDIEKYDKSSLFWKYYIHINHHNNKAFIKTIKNIPYWNNQSVEAKLSIYYNLQKKSWWELPEDFKKELDISLNYVGGKSGYLMALYFFKSDEVSQYFLKTDKIR